MVVACPSCSARFKVADEKIGPLGAKLRCSKCQKVFGVQRDATPAAAPPPPSTPPPLPGRGAPSPDLDLEPAAKPAAPQFGTLPQPDDPFAPRSAPSAGPAAIGGPPPRADDPFAAFHQVAPPPLSRPPALSRPPPLSRPPARPLAEPFAEGGTSDLLAPPPPQPPPRPVPAHLDDGLSLEEPAARPLRPPEATPAPAASPADGWLGELGGGEPEAGPGDGSSFPNVIADTGVSFGTGSMSAPFQHEPGPARTGVAERPTQRSAVEEVTARRRAAVAAGATIGQADRGARLRVALIDTFSLAVLLLAALALAAFWRGGASPAELLRPASLVAVLTNRPVTAGTFEATQVQSAFYERRRGPPLLFVRGVVTSRAAAPVGPVRVSVDVVRDGRVLAHLEGRAGGPLGLEALAEIDDAASLTRAEEAAATAAPATFAPGESLPFLVALAEVPPGLEGASVRVSADAEGPR